MKLKQIALASMALALAALAQPAEAGRCQLQRVAEMPVTMVGLRPMISAKINGVDVKLFIDTGSFANMLSPEAAARIGLRTEALPMFFEVRGVTGAANMRLATAREFTIMGVPFHNADFLVGEHGMGDGDGLISQGMLAKFDVEYDLANGVVRLFLPKDCDSNASLAYWNAAAATFIPIAPIRPPSNEITGAASVNGKKIRVQFDTGTPRSSMTIDAARRAGVLIDGPGVVSAGYGQGVGNRVIQNWLGPFASFEIGGEQVKNTQLRIGAFELEGEDMLLGADFFLSHHILISRSQDRLYFTYNGGPVFNLEQGDAPAPEPAPPAGQTAASATQDPAVAQPKTAEDFIRRAAASVARHEYDQAIADDTQAIALAPSDAQPLYERGVARELNHQPIVAMDDFDAALKLKPDDVAALMARGRLLLSRGETAGAGADFAAAQKLDPTRWRAISGIYISAKRFPDAVGEFDAWIAANPKSPEMAGALNGRCWARALWGQELEKAEQDCDAALKLEPGSVHTLDSRGLVRLRAGEFDLAIVDYNAVLRQTQGNAWSLYCRGVAKLRKGLKAEGEADVAAANKLDPRLADQAKAFGVAP